MKNALKKRTDSLNFIRNYKQSKHYKDSVEQARLARVQAQKAAQKAYLDSVTAVRKRVADSIMAYRRHYSDSIKAYNDSIREDQQRKLEALRLERKRVSDSLAAVRAYKESKHYKDSVATARQHRKDSLAAVRKHTSDSLRAIQKARTDSLIAVRKAYNDSLKTALEAAKAIRMKELDSLKAVRMARADSLAKVREARAALRKQKAEEKEKAREEKAKLALAIKIKKKQDKYSNEDMRKKKWTLPRKVMQNTFTRYNYFFNANKKMEEAIANMVRSNTDNYDSLIALFPFDPDRDSAKLLSDMDTIIRKASVGIQIHDPRAKWQDNLYLLVGQAYFYKADYQNAGAAFKQIVSQAEIAKKEAAKKKGPSSRADKNKPATYSEPEKTGLAGALEHKSSKNEAMLWLARTLTQSRKEGQAQTLLDMLRNDAEFPERLKGQLALEQAFVDLSRNDYPKASQSLAVVSADKEIPKWLRLRSNFLNGQLMQQQRHYAESDQYFREVLTLNPDLEMDFYARKNIAINSISNGSNTLSATEMLDKMAADGKYRPYYDQIYYAIGKAALKNKNNEKALASFRKSVDLSQSNKKQKGLSFAALGDEYYARSDYANARRSYDSAAMFLTPEQDPVYSMARQRAQALDRVAIPGNEVKEQDSLLRLASLSEKEQRAHIRDYIRDLERKMRDSAYMAQNMATSNTAFNLNNQGSSSWYFANPTLMKQGENEFKQKWGNRTLKDNWRRSSSLSNDFASSGEDAGDESVSGNLPDEDSLYAAIPHTPEQLKKANDRLREGLFNLGKAYYTYLEDYPKATGTFDTLDRRFPDHNHQAEVLYTRYLILMRQNQPSAAAQYNAQLQSRYPDSEWARLLKGAAASEEYDPFSKATASISPRESLSNFYDETYGLLVQRQYPEVLGRIKEADETYKNQGAFQKKFNLMKAIAIAGTGNYPEADTMLSRFISMYPGDTLTSWANTVLEYIRKHPQPAPGAGNSLQPASGSGPALDTAGLSGNLQYEYKPAAVHYVILAAPQDAKFSGLRSGLSDYNLMKQGNENISVTLSTLDAGKSLIICKEFKDAAAARKYQNEIRNVGILFREYKPGEYDILLISADNFPKLFVRKDYAAYKAFYNKNYK